ncbi:hypothetical protein [Nitrobacter sp. TKz-YC01]|uniref:hypothetical protein n=1 Tax=Nitrobacter sp. TKz-YC01 TaxID=3398703 RepID=UPI003A0FCEB8
MTGKISEDPDRVVNGSEKFAAAAGGSNFGILASSIATYLASLAQTLTNKTINAANNTISGLTTAMFAANVVDADSTFAADSDTRIPTQKAVKTATDALSSGLSGKADTSSLAAVATSGNYSDLSGTPTLGAMAAKDDVGIADIDATGTPSSSTYLRGDGSWQTPAGGGGGIEGPVSSTDSGFARWDGTDGGSLKDGAATIALGSEVSGTLPVANGGTGYTGGAFTTASGAVLKNQAGTNFGSGSYSYSYIVIGKLCIVSGRATVTTLAPNSGSDQVSIPLPINSLSNGSFTCRNTANGRIADGRTIATSPTALIYDSVGLSDGAYFDFTIIYETI